VVCGNVALVSPRGLVQSAIFKAYMQSYRDSVKMDRLTTKAILTLTRSCIASRLCERVLVLEFSARHLVGLRDRVTDLGVCRSLHGVGFGAALHAPHKIVHEVCMLVHGGKSVGNNDSSIVIRQVPAVQRLQTLSWLRKTDHRCGM